MNGPNLQIIRSSPGCDVKTMNLNMLGCYLLEFVDNNNLMPNASKYKSGECFFRTKKMIMAIITGTRQPSR
jgi:hypothetical protein